MAQPRATVDAQVDALTELLMRNHVACVSDDPRERAALLGAARRQCAELSRIYVTGLAQVHATVRAATARQYELKGEAENLASFQIPVVAAHTRRARLDEQLRRQLHCALRSYRHEAARCGAEIEACLARPEVAAMRRRAERLQQPVFGCPHQREQQRCAEDDARIRALPAMRRVVGTGQPRAYFRCTPDGLTVLTTIHGFFGIKSLHRPCRTAAGAPFGVPCVAWRAVLLSPSPRARERLGGRHVLFLVQREDARTLTGIVVGGPHGGMPAPSGDSHLTVARDAVACRPLLDAGALALPPAMLPAPSPRPADGHSKSVALELLLPCGERTALVAVGPRATALDAVPSLREDGARLLRPHSPPPTDARTVREAIARHVAAVARGHTEVAIGGAAAARPQALRATEPGYDGVAVLEVDAHLALRTMVECERAGLMVDYAEFWGGPRGQVCRRAARVPRFGERARRGGVRGRAPRVCRALVPRRARGRQPPRDLGGARRRGVVRHPARVRRRPRRPRRRAKRGRRARAHAAVPGRAAPVVHAPDRRDDAPGAGAAAAAARRDRPGQHAARAAAAARDRRRVRGVARRRGNEGAVPAHAARVL